ncbi:MAG: glycerate kinase [Chloroflexi bacterium]|nr:glycerate kinase [Chloroflexota bacterium]
MTSSSPLKIAVAPNAFRGSLTALEAVACIERGLRSSLLPCEIISMPLADGGDGTLDVWVSAKEGRRLSQAVTGPRGQPVVAEYGMTGDTALVEMARASGIELLAPDERDPLLTTTYGTGELIRAAVMAGARRIMVGVGGSATVDGGAGCLQALGGRLLDRDGASIPPGGGGLGHLARIDLSPVQELLSDVILQVLCDVDNPLLGPEGAAPVFGPQKGADAAAVRTLSENLAHFAAELAVATGVDVGTERGAGAAGGLSAGLMAGASAELVSGVEALIEDCGYAAVLSEADIALIITGEGKLDSQTGGGKAPLGIARQAAKRAIPVVAFAGSVTASVVELRRWNIQAAWSIVPHPCTLDQAVANAAPWLEAAATHLGNALALDLHR